MCLMIWCLVFSVCCLVHGVRSLVLGVCCLLLEVWCSTTNKVLSEHMASFHANCRQQLAPSASIKTIPLSNTGLLFRCLYSTLLQFKRKICTKRLSQHSSPNCSETYAVTSTWCFISTILRNVLNDRIFKENALTVIICYHRSGDVGCITYNDMCACQL